ncbi:MAG: hypothetical protein GF401_05955 [Chitinivibrionales bacterium]|nr:hypothetical protein [Chitinivibrionales bacterium]
MAKRLVGIIILVAVFSAFSATKGYDRSGIGFQIGFAVTDPDYPVEDVDLAFNFGGHGDIAFGIGRAGELHYYPSLAIWIGGDTEDFRDQFAMEININAFDTRYYPPIPQSIKVRPFVGLAPMIEIEIWDVDFEFPTEADRDDVEASAGLNLYGGADFIIKSDLVLFTEMRGNFSDWDEFKLNVGLTFMMW